MSSSSPFGSVWLCVRLTRTRLFEFQIRCLPPNNGPCEDISNTTLPTKLESSRHSCFNYSSFPPGQVSFLDAIWASLTFTGFDSSPQTKPSWVQRSLSNLSTFPTFHFAQPRTVAFQPGVVSSFFRTSYILFDCSTFDRTFFIPLLILSYHLGAILLKQ